MSESLSDIVGFPVDHSTSETLSCFADLVVKWTPRINLISRNTIQDVWTRHVLDSAQLFRFIPRQATSLVDLGSGAGFPGIVLSILARQAMPDLTVVLIEADQRKATFLREAVRQLDLSTRILCARVEDVEPLKSAVVTSRALAPLPDLMGLVVRHMSGDGLAILPKGGAYRDEVEKARLHWNFELVVHASLTDADARILKVSSLHRRIGADATS